MKFGKQFELYKIPEWFEYYFDFKGLEIILQFLDNRPIKRKELRALKKIKKIYEKKYSLNKPQDKMKKALSSFTTETQNSVNIPVYILKIKKNKLKRKRILEAEDLSLLPDDKKLERFLVIYRDKTKS